METQQFEARRATLEDLPALREMWQQADLPSAELEKFLTEFQVATAADGTLAGALGLQVDGVHGLLHSETIAVVDEPDKVRQILWLRLKIVARNLGAAKLWTLEDAPFWSTVFQQANPDEIAALTAAFQDPEASWWTYEITDIAKVQRLATEQLAIWSAVNASENQDLQETVARVRTFAVVVLILFGTVVLSLVVYAVVRTPSSVLERLLGR